MDGRTDVPGMLTKYIQAAMRRAGYEILPDEGILYGEIAELQGLWAEADTLEGCRDELHETLEEWILLGISLNHLLPVLDGIELRVKKEVA